MDGSTTAADDMPIPSPMSKLAWRVHVVGALLDRGSHQRLVAALMQRRWPNARRHKMRDESDAEARDARPAP